MRGHRGRRGFGHHHTENMIIVAIMAVLVSVAIFGLMNRPFRRAKTCIGQLVAATEGATDAKCPSASLPYPAGDHVRCPGDHLATKPHFDREGGDWRFRQELPAFAGGTHFPASEFHLWGEVASTGEKVTVTLRPRVWWKFVVGPLLSLLGLFVIVAGVKAAVAEAASKTRSAGSIAGLSIAVAIVGLLTWLVIASIWGRQTLEFTRHRVEHHVFVADRELFAPTVYAPVKALVPVKGSFTWCLLLVHGEREARATTELRWMSEGGLAAVSLMHEALFGSK
jgi:hypothetical protein